MNTLRGKHLTNDGFRKAKQLAFACFVEDLTLEKFQSLSKAEQFAFAKGNAQLDAEGLITAFRFLGAYHEACAAALKAHVASRAAPRSDLETLQ